MDRLDRSKFQKVQQLILRIEELHNAGRLDESNLSKAQEALDNLANDKSLDPSLESNKYVLYELQALIHEFGGETELAENFIIDAIDAARPEDQFVSEYANKIASTVNGIGMSSQESPFTHRNTPPKIAGWLAIYGVGLIFTPFYLIADVFWLLDPTNTSGLDSFTSMTIWAIGISEIIIAVYIFYIWSSFFRKKKEFIMRGRLLQKMLIIYSLSYIILALMLATHFDTSESYEAYGSLAGETFWSLILATGWFLYLRKSKRVQTTFIKD